MRLKICGITRPAEVAVLQKLSVDFAGLWHGVPGGAANLQGDRLAYLASTIWATGRLQPVLVTFQKDPVRLLQIIAQTGIRWVQLHGFQSPGVVASLRRSAPSWLRIVKVLHLKEDSCFEQALVPAYEQAGVDVFLFDTATDDGRVGSTGQGIDAAAALRLAGDVARPFFLAGGISAENCAKYTQVRQHPYFFGIDVDTNARNAVMALCPESISALSRNWRGHSHGGLHHADALR